MDGLDMRYGFGIDVGGTTVKLGLFTEPGELLEKWEIPTRTEDHGGAILPDIVDAVEVCLVRRGLSKEQVLGLGIGVPGPVRRNGVVDRCANLGWGTFRLEETLSARLGLPVKAGNDANVAALGEYWQGGGQGYSSMILVTLGTGIGGGIVVDGKILYGAHGAGGEIGHIRLADQGPVGYGKRGSVEGFCSGGGVKQLAETYAREALQAGGAPPWAAGEITAKTVAQAAMAGEPVACAVYAEVGRWLGRALDLLNPQRIVIGSIFARSGGLMIPAMERELARECLPGSLAACQIVPCELGEDMGGYGCMAVAETRMKQ